MSGTIPRRTWRLKWLWIVLLLIPLAAISLFEQLTSKTEAVPLSAAERTWIKTHPVVRFAPDPDFPPTEYFDENGSYSGITADYLALIAKKLGIRFEIVRLRNWDQVISQARAGRIDLFAASETPQRSRFASFTRPYLELPAAIIAREKVREPLTPDKLMGMKVSVVSGYAVQEYLSSRYPGLQLDVVPDVQTGLRKVSFGTSDALVENLATASYYIEREGISNLRIAGESGFSYRMAFGSRRDWPLLRRILEKGLDRITPAEKKAIYRRWVPLEPKSLFASKGFRTAMLVSFYAAVLLIAGIVIWNRALSRQVRARTGELERELGERRRIEEELRESEEKFRVLAETSPTGICLYQGERIVYVNAAAAQLFGYTEQECLGMNFWDWVHEDSRDLVKSRGMARQRREEVPSSYECRHVTKNCDQLWLFVSAGLIEFRGAPAGIVSYVDITDRKQMEEKLRHAYDNLERMVEERTVELADTVVALRKSEQEYQKLATDLELLNNTLEMRVEEEVAKNREKDHLLILQNRQAALGEALDHIAHQWKQPINAISLIVQDLEPSYLRGAVTLGYIHEIVDKVVNLVGHMAQTISVFRDFYRPDRETAIFRLRESIDRTLMFIEPALRFSCVAVDLEADPELAAQGNPKEYAQVILNILSNAKDIFEERGVENPLVTIRAFADDGKAVVTVTDNAGGIPDEVIGRIFEPYFTTRETHGGTGIGLYMSKNIIERNMDGRLEVENVENGARFRIELDRAVC